MTNKELFKLWEEFKAEQFNCYPDKEGNYPCDNGELCDRCCTDEAICWFASWKHNRPNRGAKQYWVTVSDTASYPFPEDTPFDEARSLAWNWFTEREPTFEISGLEDEE